MSKIPDSTVFTIFEWFQQAMKRCGRKVKWPQCRDKTKTYLFRSLQTYADRCYNELELDDKIVRILTFNIVEYAKRKGLLNKGAQMLCMDLVVDICYNSIQEIIDSESSLISEIKHCHKFVEEQLDGKDNPVRLMVESDIDGGYPRLVTWYHQGYITPQYLALNRQCMRALFKIPTLDKEDLPNALELFKICSFAVSDDTIEPLKEVLGDNLRLPPIFKQKEKIRS